MRMYSFFNNNMVSDENPLVLSQDRGFLLADGLFETFKIIQGKAVYLNEHLNRLFHGAEILGISHQITVVAISKAITDLIDINQFSEEILSARVTLTRGVGPRGLLPPENIAATILLTLSPYIPVPDRPWTLCVARNRRNEFSSLSHIKSLSYTDNILAKIQAQKMGADDALFLNTQGNVACTTCANIFMVKDNMLITPPLTDGILPGITRQKVIEESSLSVEERSITLSELQSADDIFITNALLGIKKISSL